MKANKQKLVGLIFLMVFWLPCLGQNSGQLDFKAYQDSSPDYDDHYNWDIERRAVVKIVFNTPDGTYRRGTGFLVIDYNDPNPHHNPLVLTSGHLLDFNKNKKIDPEEFQSYDFTFQIGYHISDLNTGGEADEEVFTDGGLVVAAHFDDTNDATYPDRYYDYALLRINGTVSWDTPFLGISSVPDQTDPLMLLHHPGGEPLKVLVSPVVENVHDGTNLEFQKQVQGYGSVESGSSGSPVFNSKSHQLVGLLYGSLDGTNCEVLGVCAQANKIGMILTHQPKYGTSLRNILGSHPAAFHKYIKNGIQISRSSIDGERIRCDSRIIISVHPDRPKTKVKNSLFSAPKIFITPGVEIDYTTTILASNDVSGVNQPTSSRSEGILEATRQNMAGVEAKPSQTTTAFPNPGRPVNFRLSGLSGSESVIISIYDLQGRKRRQLEATHTAENLTTMWDGKDSSGKDLPAGNYIARIVWADGYRMLRVVLN